MKIKNNHIPIVSVAVLLPASVTFAAGPLSPTESAAGIGGEVSFLDREATLSGPGVNEEIEGEGLLAGVHGYIQRGALFRGEFRLLGGELEFDGFGLDSDDETVTFAGLRGTFGTEAGGGRVYTGLGATRHEVDFPAVDWTTYSIYVPVGFSKAKAMSREWTALTTVELRAIVLGEEELDTSVADETFDQGTGVGGRVAIQFRNTSGLEIQPFVDFMSPGDSDDESGFEAQDIRNVSSGVRLNWTF